MEQFRGNMIIDTHTGFMLDGEVIVDPTIDVMTELKPAENDGVYHLERARIFDTEIVMPLGDVVEILPCSDKHV